MDVLRDQQQWKDGMMIILFVFLVIAAQGLALNADTLGTMIQFLNYNF